MTLISHGYTYFDVSLLAVSNHVLAKEDHDGQWFNISSTPEGRSNRSKTVLTIWCYLSDRGLHDWFVEIVPNVSTMLKETQDNWDGGGRIGLAASDWAGCAVLDNFVAEGWEVV